MRLTQRRVILIKKGDHIQNRPNTDGCGQCHLVQHVGGNVAPR